MSLHGAGEHCCGHGTERVLPVTPVGMDLAVPGTGLAVPGHPCAPLVWAPMETLLLPGQGTHPASPTAHPWNAKQEVSWAV